MARKPAAGTRPAAVAADEQQRRRGRPRQYERALLWELWRELEANPALEARKAARLVVARHPGAPASPESRARHLLRLAARDPYQPGPTTIEALLLFERVTREGQRIRRRGRARDKLRWTKQRAASRRWGALYWQARRRYWVGFGLPREDNDHENLADFLASLDRWFKYNRDSIR